MSAGYIYLFWLLYRMLSGLWLVVLAVFGAVNLPIISACWFSFWQSYINELVNQLGIYLKCTHILSFFCLKLFIPSICAKFLCWESYRKYETVRFPSPHSVVSWACPEGTSSYQGALASLMEFWHWANANNLVEISWQLHQIGMEFWKCLR